ncbi:TPA: site-specific integrase [Vibrio cholerae]|nr:site-specific integrase [Vibrio cholerae]
MNHINKKTKPSKSNGKRLKSQLPLDCNAYPIHQTAYAVCRELRDNEDLAESTFIGMKTHARHLIHTIGEIPLDQLTTSDIDDFRYYLIHEVGVKGKVVNGCFTLLRSICSKAKKDRVLSENLMDGVKNMTIVEEEPKPFNEDELRLIINADCEDDASRLMVVFGSLTALRISELLCLSWDNVEYKTEGEVEKATIYIDLAKPLKNYKITKTPRSEREIELSPEATIILRNLEQHTKDLPPIKISIYQRDNITIKTEQRKFIFYNNKTGQPWLHPKQFANQFFTPFLKELGIAHRGPNQLRHTCASMHFNNGSNLAWIADLLGHTSVAIVEKHYAKRRKISLKKEQDKANQKISDLFKNEDENSIVMVMPKETSTAKQSVDDQSIPDSDKKFIFNLMQLARQQKNDAHREQIYQIIESTLMASA